MIIIALGSNQCSVWGKPKQALQRALDELAKSGIEVLSVSAAYYTRAYSKIAQANFWNAAALINTPMGAAPLLSKFKQIEAQAGRGQGNNLRFQQNRWLPRPIDLDIIAYHELVCNWDKKMPRFGSRVVLPHPRAHERAFVLCPVAEIAPYWHHPIFRLTAQAMLKRPGVAATGAVLARDGPLEPPGPSGMKALP